LDTLAIHLLAVAQEALSNVARHAHATAVEVQVSAGTDLIVQVSDNGRGLGELTRVSGLRNMRQRAEALGGMFDVASQASAGTRLEWRIPLTPRGSADR
jgi:signal transduction histidine kinase